MTNPNDVIFSCSESEMIVYSHTFPKGFPYEVKHKFRVAFARYHIRFRTEETHRMLNNQTLGYILANVPPEMEAESVIASGKVDGMSYTLHKPVQAETKSDNDGTVTPIE